MIPKSLSATSVQVFEACPARWVAEYFHRAPQPSSVHADLGTAVHYGLEQFVKLGHHMNLVPGSVDTLISFYTEEYERLFDDNEKYDEGVEMLRKWFRRQDWLDRTVLSTEVKENFTIKAKGEQVTFNFIWDRCDRVEVEGGYEVEVVDYKTISRPFAPDQLRKKIQARCYGLAAQIKYPDALRTWVNFDLLRYDPIAIVFTRDENIATYRYLQRTFARILEMEEEKAEERLNPECHWCIRKLDCDSLTKNIAAGGAFGITDPQTAAAKRYLLEHQKKAIDAAISELDGFILQWAEANDTLEVEHDLLDVQITASRRRSLDSERAKHVVGADLLAEYGSLGVTAVDKLLKDSRLTPEQRAELKGMINYKYGEPKVAITSKSPIDDS